MSETPGLSIVIPLYNGAATIPALVREVSALDIDGGLEIIFVNDGSEDDSAEVAAELVRTASVPVTLIDLSRNFGEHNAVMAGLRHARGRYVITMDDDLQNPPREVKRLYDFARTSDSDVVYAHYLEKKHSCWRQFGSWFANRSATLFIGKPPGLYLSSFRCMNRFIVDKIIPYHGPFPYIDGLILQVTSRLVSLDVEHLPRAEGRSNYTLRRLISLWLIIALNFSIMPLRICTLLGMTMTALGLLGIVEVFVEFFSFGIASSGWAALTVTVLVFSGTQLLILGLIGEYVGKMYLTVNGRPQSVVRGIVRPQSGQAQAAEGPTSASGRPPPRSRSAVP